MVNNSQSQNDNIVYGLVAVAMVLLIIGLFLPIINVNMGLEGSPDSASFMNNGEGVGSDAIMIIGLLVISGGLVAIKRTRWVILTGILILGILFINYLDISDTVSLFKSLDIDASMGMFAWALLYLGSFAMIGAGGLAFKNSRTQSTYQQVKATA